MSLKTPTFAALLRRARVTLAETGLLLLSDPQLPSLVSLVVGAPVAGTWWSHPDGNYIYNLANALADCGDVATFKLIGGKVTYVHASLWPALAGAGQARQAWQTAGLTDADENLLRALRRAGELRSNAWPAALLRACPEASKVVKRLEPRLLFHAESFHIESGSGRGAHATRLRSWDAWVAGWPVAAAASPAALAGADARAALEAAYAALSGGVDAKARLPWLATRRASRSKSVDK